MISPLLRKVQLRTPTHHPQAISLLFPFFPSLSIIAEVKTIPLPPHTLITPSSDPAPKPEQSEVMAVEGRGWKGERRGLEGEGLVRFGDGGSSFYWRVLAFWAGLDTFRLMSNKKPSKKKEEQREQEVQREIEQQKLEGERQQKEERLRELAAKSQPLLQFGLLDAYQHFLAQLAGSGIPQANLYEFAAQSMLRFQKTKSRKKETLREVEHANQEAMKAVSESHNKSKGLGSREIKPQMLPFKGQLNEKELGLLGKQ